MAIPWSSISITPSNGLKLGFDIANDDNDAGTKRDFQTVWSGNSNNFNNTSQFGTLFLLGTTASEKKQSEHETLFVYPNPANGHVKISFSLGKSRFVSLKLYDMLGREINTVFEGELPHGSHEYNFSSTTPGIYFLKLKAGEEQLVRKVIFNH